VGNFGYKGDIKISLARKLRKLWKKNKVSYEFVLKKIDEIIENPNRYKHLVQDKKGECRVHIGSYVLTFEIKENEGVVEFLDYDHHDNIYKKRG